MGHASPDSKGGFLEHALPDPVWLHHSSLQPLKPACCHVFPTAFSRLLHTSHIQASFIVASIKVRISMARLCKNDHLSFRHSRHSELHT